MNNMTIALFGAKICTDYLFKDANGFPRAQGIIYKLQIFRNAREKILANSLLYAAWDVCF